jgi:hypothetical protein
VALKHSTKEKSAANHGATTSSNNNNGGTTTLDIERREPENGLAVVSLGKSIGPPTLTSSSSSSV